MAQGHADRVQAELRHTISEQQERINAAVRALDRVANMGDLALADAVRKVQEDLRGK